MAGCCPQAFGEAPARDPKRHVHGLPYLPEQGRSGPAEREGTPDEAGIGWLADQGVAASLGTTPSHLRQLLGFVIIGTVDLPGRPLLRGKLGRYLLQHGRGLVPEALVMLPGLLKDTA